MRTFAIALGCFAWILSCFDAVSYYRASEEQQVVSVRLKAAERDARGSAALAGQDTVRLQERVKQDEAMVINDQRSLDRTQKQRAGDGQDQQTLAADQAALQADRMMQYTVENFTRMEPNPRVVAAVNRVDLDGKQLADAVATQVRDRVLAHGLIALWVVVAGTGFLAFRGARKGEAVAGVTGDDADGLEGEDELETDLATAEDTDL